VKKSLCAVALALLSLCALPVAADSPRAQEDQAFLASLSQEAEAPAPALPEGLSPAALALCIGAWCNSNLDCYSVCPGGAGSSYCNRVQHRCYPY
jgi:hypothetical protein